MVIAWGFVGEREYFTKLKQVQGSIFWLGFIEPLPFGSFFFSLIRWQ